MAWFGLDKLFLGYDLDAEQRRSDQLDNELRDFTAESIDSGRYNDAYSTAFQEHTTSDTSFTGVSVVDSVGNEFEAGLEQGFNNVLNAPGKVVGPVGGGAGQVLWGILKNIPWWVYLAGTVTLFIWLGGLELLRGRLARR